MLIDGEETRIDGDGTMTNGDETITENTVMMTGKIYLLQIWNSPKKTKAGWDWVTLDSLPQMVMVNELLHHCQKLDQ